ncbi:hypothetical protein HID58_023354 [Brassica napus]|uniref:Uncharacterized protein n=1 Tax=Brassica napus TaxID=3708 RepID=A0ABQ8D218_BRANA|nr:hypothetical protein HID58_023354 [Brassica napus]
MIAWQRIARYSATATAPAILPGGELKKTESGRPPNCTDCESFLTNFLILFSAWEVEATMDFVRHESSILHHVHKNSVNHGFITAARANHWAMHHVYKTTDHPFVIRFIPTTTVSKVPLLTSPQLLELWSVFSLTRNLYLDSPQDQVLR